ncbi:hypothetical protein [Rhizobium laguerreae]|uniref:hypothetical protein n=1 Tax=Rhizobium laguerreae TaxID=1076926 RepID=UPI001FEF27E1|nr:hypothetical protein [Rhizobium laguerreae]
MTELRQRQVDNRLLRRFPEDAFELLAPLLEPVELPVNHSLVRPRQAIEHVCFIESGLASMIVESADGRSVEIRHIRREGIYNAIGDLRVEHEQYEEACTGGIHGLALSAGSGAGT